MALVLRRAFHSPTSHFHQASSSSCCCSTSSAASEFLAASHKLSTRQSPLCKDLEASALRKAFEKQASYLRQDRLRWNPLGLLPVRQQSTLCKASEAAKAFRKQAWYVNHGQDRLRWNPLGLLPARQLCVRHNTQQPAQTPPTSPPKTPSNSLVVPSCTVPATSSARRAFLVDTLAVMRRLEAQELSPRQAEAITAVVTTVLNDSLESVAQAYTSKADMQKCEMLQEATLSKFKAEIQASLEHHFATLQRESERLRTDMEKMRSELRYEIDKVQANQRLDLNLERGHIRDELNKQQSETSNLTNKLDREIHSLKTQLEAAKYDVIKYCIGTIVSVTALGLGLLRIIM